MKKITFKIPPFYILREKFLKDLGEEDEDDPDYASQLVSKRKFKERSK